jgi:hypothetical protein
MHWLSTALWCASLAVALHLTPADSNSCNHAWAAKQRAAITKAYNAKSYRAVMQSAPAEAQCYQALARSEHGDQRYSDLLSAATMWLVSALTWYDAGQHQLGRTYNNNAIDCVQQIANDKNASLAWRNKANAILRVTPVPRRTPATVPVPPPTTTP